MAEKNSDYMVVNDSGGWAVKKGRAARASARFATQREAIERAKEMAGRGVVKVQDRHGKFRALTPYD